MQWSDGQPITAQDFKWTYDQVKDPAHAFPYLSQLDFIRSYEALDDYTLQIKIKEVYAPAWARCRADHAAAQARLGEARLERSAEEPRDQQPDAWSPARTS